MDDHHFDRLARALGLAGTRRGLVRGLTALPAMAALLAGVDSQGEGAAKRRRKKKRKKQQGGSATQPACPPCAAGKQCVNGACVSQCAPDCTGKACGASDGCGGSCQTGSCHECQTCQAGQCVAATNGVACESGNQCARAAVCQGGACVVESEEQCFPPVNVCLTASCNPANGICENAPRAAGYPCQVSETCRENHGSCNGQGACASEPIACWRPGEVCCASGPSQDECRLQNGESCTSNAQCCNNNCFFGYCYSF